MDRSFYFGAHGSERIGSYESESESCSGRWAIMLVNPALFAGMAVASV